MVLGVLWGPSGSLIFMDYRYTRVHSRFEFQPAHSKLSAIFTNDQNLEMSPQKLGKILQNKVVRNIK